MHSDSKYAFIAVLKVFKYHSRPYENNGYYMITSVAYLPIKITGSNIVVFCMFYFRLKKYIIIIILWLK